MSLDVYLEMPNAVPQSGSGIFIREEGTTKEISREEWGRRFPDREPVICLKESESRRVYNGNITHNLNAMAEAAGIYKCLWRPDENGITQAKQLIHLLKDGLAELQTHPEKYKPLNPENGWGDYHGLMSFVSKYLAACEEYPEAQVTVWR